MLVLGLVGGVRGWVVGGGVVERRVQRSQEYNRVGRAGVLADVLEGFSLFVPGVPMPSPPIYLSLCVGVGVDWVVCTSCRDSGSVSVSVAVGTRRDAGLLRDRKVLQSRTGRHPTVLLLRQAVVPMHGLHPA